MKRKIASWIALSGALLLAAGISLAGDSVVIEKVPPDLNHLGLLEGAELYQGFCAACHGLAAKGDGPAAGALNPIPSDLTCLSEQHGGTFPTLSVMHAISGKYQETAYHSEMPAWEKVFVAATGDPLGARLRVRNLTRYLEEIQRPAD
jgi:hypothetical protein